ncbi:MAG: CHAT domain-containing protein [Magnetococcales bacterium]|nr:CHAT domain-containing protein [Magnetococcales bacterium]
MIKVRTIHLEILRHGPPHNQLLSPLTDYLGLCGNHQATLMRVPYEHAEFMGRIRELQYPDVAASNTAAEQRRIEEIGRFADQITAFLGGVPGLIAALAHCPADQGSLTHLRLVVSHDELALLPFELARVTPGFPGGHGNPLLVQSIAPLCLTRQARNATSTGLVWPRQPRLLFIHANPHGGPFPDQAHLNALVAAIKPWIAVLPPENHPHHGAALKQAVEQHLVVLSNPTMPEIREVCARQSFTHVHVLAHGAPIETLPGRPYGLAFPSAAGRGVDVVSGQRFAALLGGLDGLETAADGSQGQRGPVVVTLASCDSAHQSGEVWQRTGVSFAHDLHQAGIPLVVASQFPLSMAGSVLIPRLFLRDLLWGGDPRMAAHRLRTELFALHPEAHDWASLVVYDALPENLEQQLAALRLERAKRAIDTALDHIDRALDDKSDSDSSDIPILTRGFIQVEEAEQRLHPDRLGLRSTRVNVLRASTAKRKAGILFEVFKGLTTKSADQLARLRTEPATQGFLEAARVVVNLPRKEAGPGQDHPVLEAILKRSMDELQLSYVRYQKNVRLNMGCAGYKYRRENALHWSLTQVLSLQAAWRQPLKQDYWLATLLSGQLDLTAEQNNDRLWAHASLTELYLILLAYEEQTWSAGQRVDSPWPRTHNEARDQAMGHLRQMIGLEDNPLGLSLLSTRRQLLRYVDWWSHPDFVRRVTKGDHRWPAGRQADSQSLLVEVAQEMADLLPGAEQGGQGAFPIYRSLTKPTKGDETGA